jgi:putative component of toxin-antitoxin plasmid stabilization module
LDPAAANLQGKLRILARLDRLAAGNPGDVEKAHELAEEWRADKRKKEAADGDQ